MKRTLPVVVLLVLALLVVYARAVSFDFVNFDDDVYVTQNPHVLGGLTAPNVAWAFTTDHASNWHPLTWLSLMLDAQIGGGSPGAYHATNVVLHLLATVLLFLALERMIRRPWPSGFVAALFALHPLHVESVAWIAERKDVLSAVFWFLTMLAYARYAERPGRGRYALVVLALSAGLLAKPMLVTLPAVLLLLDVWPLRRTPFAAGDSLPGSPHPARTWRTILLEKVPLAALALASCAVTLIAQSRGGALKTFEAYPFGQRAANALVATTAYLGQAVWPVRLAVFYPHPRGSLAAPMVAGCALFLVATTAIALKLARHRPWLAVGWLWYLITLLPVIGLVQVGEQARADRYTYIPLVGIFLMVGWEALAAAGGGAREVSRLRLVTAPCLAALIALGIVSWRQLEYWRDGAALFQRAVAVTGPNRTAQNNLGSALYRQGRIEEAAGRYERAIAIDPAYADAHANLSLAFLQLGRVDEAVHEARDAVRLRPEIANAALGLALLRQGHTEEAVAAFAEQVRLQPAVAGGLVNLGSGLLLLGRRDEAIARFSEALRLEPGNTEARLNLGGALVEAGRLEEGIAAIEAVLRVRPDDPRALRYLAAARKRRVPDPRP